MFSLETLHCRKLASGRPFIPFEQHKAIIRPSKEEIAGLAEVLNSAQKVTILGGAGCAGAHSELIQVAGLLKAPIVHAMRGKEFIEYDNPYDVGMTGLLGFSSGYHAMMDSDLLLMLGTDFPYQQFYPPNAYIIQVDIRGEQIGRRTKVDLGLVGDVHETLVAVKPLLNQKSHKGHLRASLDHYKKSRKDLDSYAVGEPGRTPIHPQYVAKIINDVAAHDAIFTCDVGTPTLWAGTVPEDERQSEIIRLLFAWLDGKCPATGDRSPGSFSKTSGNLPFRRWWIFDAHGRFSIAKTVKTACKYCSI